MKLNAIPIYLLEAGCIIAWSSGFIGARLAADTSSMFLVLFWRFTLVALILSPFLLKSGGQFPSIRSVCLQIALGAFAMFGYLILGVKSIELGVPVGTAALISALQPLATAVVAGLFLLESISRRQWFGLMLGFIGVFFAIGGTPSSASPMAYGLSLASMASLVLATLLAKSITVQTAMLPALAIQSATAAILFAPFAAIEGTLIPTLAPHFVAAVIWFIFLSTIAGYGLYWLCLQRSSAIRVASLIYLTPPVTMIWAWIMFNEPITPAAICGFVLCLLGVLYSRKQGVISQVQEPVSGTTNVPALLNDQKSLLEKGEITGR